MEAYINGKRLQNFVILKSKNKSFTQHKEPTSIKKKVLIKEQYPIRSLLVKKGFKHFIGYKDTKKLDLHVYFYQNDCI